jgi:hypothetical protein
MPRDLESKHGSCFHPKNMDENACDWLKKETYDGDDGMKATASYDDSLGSIETGQNFGCIHWEGLE